jgi:hypothetical protein
MYTPYNQKTPIPMEWQIGRRAAMDEVLGSLSEDSRAEIERGLKRVIKKMKKKSHGVKLSTYSAFEILWEIMIFLDDPAQRRRSHIRELYLRYYGSKSADYE